MEYKILKAEKHLDNATGFRLRIITSKTEREVIHSHDYYEIFVTLSDNITHHINGKTEKLKKGTLVFIRPADTHCCLREAGSYDFINLAFSAEIAKSLFAFFSNEFPVNSFLSSKHPPKIELNSTDFNSITKTLKKLNTITWDNTRNSIICCKMILTTIFSKYLMNYQIDSPNEVPYWLLDVCALMHKNENFIEGIDAMVRLSGRTYEHLSRKMKQYYNQTVTEFINDIRLNYAANLIRNTNLSMTTIALECGFNTQSWFFVCFKNKYGISPNQFRNQKS